MKIASFWLAGIAAAALPLPAGAQEPASAKEETPAAVEFIDENHRTLHEEYQTGLALCDDKHMEELSKLDTSYMSALETLLEKLIKLKVAAAMEIVKLEIARVDMGVVERSSIFSNAPDKVKELRDIYEAARAKVEKKNLNRLVGVWLRYDQGLQKIEKSLTMNNQIEKALAVRTIRQHIKNPAKKVEQPKVAATPGTPPVSVGEGTPRPWRKPRWKRPRDRETPGNGGRDASPLPEPPDPSSLATMDLPELKPLGTSELASAQSDLGPKPRRGTGGYPVLMRSLRAGEVDEIDPDKITSWGHVSPQSFGGENYWAVNFIFTANTLFGSQECGGTALVKGGKVVRWVYTVSGRPIR